MKRWLFLVVLLCSSNVWADCTSPAAIEGTIRYNSTTKKLVFCDGTNWINSNGASHEIVTKSADESLLNVVVPQNDDHLFFSIAANETVRFEMVAFHTGGATPDIQWQVTGPGTPVNFKAGVHFTNNSGAGGSSCGGTISTYASTIGCNYGSAQDFARTYITGVIVNGATAGTVNIKWSNRVTGGATPTVVEKGSHLVLYRQ